MKVTNIDKVLKQLYLGPSKWELDTIIYHDRLSNSKTFYSFLSRIKELKENKLASQSEKQELAYLLEMLEDVEEDDISYLTSLEEEEIKESFIEDLARRSALESLTRGKLDFETLDTACKLSPNDFILCAKRTQDLINSITGLVIKGENLSKDVAGA